MKKTSIRLLAMLLCVLSLTALLPTVAFAAEPIDEVGDAFGGVIANVKDAATKSNTTLTRYIPIGYKGYWMKWSGPSGTKYQWQIKKPGSSWKNIKGATKPKYTIKKFTTGLKNARYRCVAKYRGKKYISPTWYLKAA